MPIKAGLVTSLYSHDIILVLVQWIIRQEYKKKKYLVTGDWSQSTRSPERCRNKSNISRSPHSHTITYLWQVDLTILSCSFGTSIYI